MVEVSELAATAFVESLRERGLGSGKGFRLRKRKDEFKLEIDNPAENDHVIRHEGRIALIVDQGIEEELGAVLIDLEERPDGSKLVMRGKPSHPPPGVCRLPLPCVDCHYNQGPGCPEIKKRS